MKSAAPGVILIFAVLALAGCIGSDPPPEQPSPQDPEPPCEDCPVDRPEDPGTQDPGEPDEETQPPGPADGAPEWTWPSLESATIRPGVQLVIGNSQCTSNFVFLDSFNQSVYLGTAAHCFADGDEQEYENGCDPKTEVHDLGQTVDIEGASNPGHLVYTSWGTMQENNETAAIRCDGNDFAILQVDPADADKVHPSMKTFGGPTDMTKSSAVQVNDKVLTFGATGLRDAVVAQGPEVIDAREGYVIAKQNDWIYVVYTVTPGLPGDSGSAVVLADGPALGILSTLIIAPNAGGNGVVDLSRALSYANQHSDIGFYLGTWEVLSEGTLP